MTWIDAGLARLALIGIMPGMVSLTDHQLKTVMTAADAVPVERRGVFLERVAAMLRMRGRFTDADVHDVVRLATAGLVHAGAA